MKNGTNVNKYELMWILPSIILPVVMLGILTYTAFDRGIKLPTDVGVVNPVTALATPPFNKTGVVQLGPKHYKVTMVAGIWFFLPNQIKVPAGSTVDFIATSKDVIHGLFIKEANVNVMLIPGEITRVTAHFGKPGEYPFICHEYCGAAHHTMWGKVVVEPAS